MTTTPHPTHRDRSRSVLRIFAAGALLVVAGVIVFVLKIGPVALTLTATHGVHVGDALATIPTVLAGIALFGRRRSQLARS